ncbi:hypothetical protein MSHRCOH1_05405 [Candidatus Ornithobacterium hominis]|nr:hypothetical protein MSHRCOH1_05225 [Candidatus Ornithobacterium hominis]CAI9429629.1 hypothetical protein MSHRCOH1_05405 [Candidatus Ornithobacterium hominis]
MQDQYNNKQKYHLGYNCHDPINNEVYILRPVFYTVLYNFLKIPKILQVYYITLYLFEVGYLFSLNFAHIFLI